MRRAVLLLLALAAPARAQSAADKATAETLFEAARKAFEAGSYAEACPKFADSLRLDRGVGVALYTGDCFQKLGKMATAARAFQDALALANAQGDSKRAAVAQRFLDKIKPSKLTLKAPELAGLVLQRDGAETAPGVITLDGGKYRITASAPGHQPFEQIVELPSEGADVIVQVTLAPALEKQAPPPAVVTEEPPRSPAGTLRAIGISMAVTGAAGVAIGAALGVMAMSDWDASNDPAIGRCDPSSEACRAQKGVDLRASANALGAGCTAALVAGSVLFVSGATLFLLAPLTTPKGTPRARLVPTLGGALLEGTF